MTEQSISEPPLHSSESSKNAWYLGLDVGTTSLAATLFNPVTKQLYPLSWPNSSFPNGSLVPPLSSFKPHLNVAIPYQSPKTHEWEPKIQRSSGWEMSLYAVEQALVNRLAPLTDPQLSATEAGCTAVGLDAATLNHVIKRLAGVVLSYPVGASDAYCFNLREIVLQAGLVSRPEQIFFMEEAIAALLAESYQSHQVSDAESTALSLDSESPTALTEAVLVISAGATSTDFLLTDLPANPTQLQRSDLFLRRCSYGGNALDQDIICQLLYPLQSSWPDLSDLPTPLAGEPDLEVRYQLQQKLEKHESGQQLLAQVRPLKLKLIQGDTPFVWGQKHYSLRQTDFHNWVISPYLQQIHREVSLLLMQTGLNGEAIRQVICTGGTASIPAIAQSLREKFPTARITQDFGLEEGSSPASHQRISSGLSLLPQFPGVLDWWRHQYSELFLLHKLLEVLLNQPEQPLSRSHILQLLKDQNISTDDCETTVLNLLEGQIPTGLVPGRVSELLFGMDSQSLSKDLAALAAPLFSRQDHHLYQVVPKQRDRLWAYLKLILSHTRQTLEEPLAVNLLPTQQSSNPTL